jgi:hypothetical protein
MLRSIGDFAGIIFILFGGVMCFAGSKFLFWIITTLIFVVSDALMFLLAFNLFIDLKSPTGLVIGVLCFTTVVAGLIAYFGNKAAQKLAVPILGGCAGAALLDITVKTFDVTNVYVNMAALVIGGAGGAYAGLHLDRHVKTISTAIIGSFLFFRGLGFYLPGYPGMEMADDPENVEYDPTALAYIAGNIVFAILGAYV